MSTDTVTSVRNKLVVIPKVDENLNCIYKADQSTQMTDGENDKIKTYNLNISSRLQYTMINGKTVFVCVPTDNSFDDTLTV